MLKTLTVWNFALLEHVQVEFGPGLNILTGETGAGKSILIDSLGAVLGQRVSADNIRSGCDWLRVEAVFSLDEESLGLHEFLTQQAIDDSENMLIVTRQVTRNGRSNVLVNGCHVTLATLKRIGMFLVDIHGQNENLALLKEESQLHLLDTYDPDLSEALAAYECAYRAWIEQRKRYDEKRQASREYAQRLDMLHWQDKEITDAGLKEGEDEELEAEIRKLSHAEKIVGFVEESYNLLDGGSSRGLSVLAALSQVKKDLGDMSRFDQSLENAQKIVEEAFVSLQEAAYELRDYGENMEFSPERLDTLQQRMDLIYRLCKKYGATVADVLAHQQKVQQELLDIENYDDDIAALEKKIASLEAELARKAQRLTKLRQAAADDLSAAIRTQLLELGMPQARFYIAVTPADQYGPHGRDEVAMYFRPMPAKRRNRCRKWLPAVNSRVLPWLSRPWLPRGIPRCRAWSSMKSIRASAAARPRWSPNALPWSRSTSRYSASRICRRSPAWPMSISTSRRASRTIMRSRRCARFPSASRSARLPAWLPVPI